MPTMWWSGGTQLATNVLMPMRARQIWLLGPSECSKASARQFLFVRAPAHLGRRRPFFAKALDAPCVDELVDLFGSIGNLRIALAAMNDLDAKLVGQVVELPRLGVVRDLLGLRAGELPLREGPLRDIEERVLREMADQAGLAPCSSTAVGPGSFHDAIIRRSFMWRQYSVRSVGCLLSAPAYGSQSSTDVLM